MTKTEAGASVATQLRERARRVLPGGHTHAARAYEPAVYVTRAQGSRKWLVDGREIVDYTMGHGALLLGHAHPEVVRAVGAQLSKGTHYGAAHPLEVEWAERIASLVPSVDQVRFTASGTEAAMLALRLSRAFTGRNTVVKLDGHFHGWSDSVSFDLDGEGTLKSEAGVAGPLSDVTRVARPDIDSIRDALRGGDVAALILEVSGAHYGTNPLPDGLVAEIRSACDEHGALLVFDEVVTGFRVTPGGMQALVGVRPDLTLFGKVMAGGLPGGAVGGRRDVMQLLDGTVMHPGTYNANPLSAAAGITTLRIIADGAAQDAAEEYARTLETRWRDALVEAEVPGRVWRLSSILHVRLDDESQQASLSNALRDNGIDLLRTSAFCSAVHTEEDLELSALAMRRAAESLRA